MKILRILPAALLLLLAAAAPAQEGEWRHGMSLMGTPRYPADFKRFDYVNPAAPKGGLLRMSTEGSFDSLNIVPRRGLVAIGVSLIYDSLLTPSMDEISTSYGLLAEAMRYPADFSSVTFRLRSNARWHDGKPVTPEDVVWSFDMLKQHNPGQAFYYRHIVKAEQTGEREITFTADGPGNRELPSIVGQLNVMPKHWWTGTDANGKPRDITAATLETPLGNGAYRIKTVIPGRTISYERVPDYWGKDLPVNVGKDNFDEIRWEYYRDDTVELEAFKADHYDFRIESSGKNWATAYDFPARRDGRVILEKFSERARGVMQGFIFNLRRDKFKDPARAARLQLCIRFRGVEPHAIVGRIRAHQFLLQRHRARLRGIAERQGARNPRDRARPGAGRGVHQAVRQSQGRQRRGAARQPARGDAASARGGLRDPRPQAGERQDRRAVHGRISAWQPELRARDPVL